jgi:NitT/TauT family transport system substrate-binding protein
MKRVTTLAIVLLSLLSLAACSQSQRTEAEPLIVGVVTWVGSGPFFLARDKGLFDGLVVEIQIIDDAAGRRAALAQGSIQAMAATVDDFANAAAAGLPGIAILKTDDSYGGDGIVASADISSVADLKGKSVAFPQGMPSHFFLLDALRKQGLSTRDLQVNYMEAGEAGAAFVAGKVDAAVTWEPWLSKATERQGGHVLLTTETTPGLISDIVVANKPALATRREDFKKFVRGWFAALDYMKTHRDESDRLMAKALNLPLSDWNAILGGIRLADREENLKYFGLKGSDNEFGRVFTSAGEVWKMEGLVDKPAPLEDVVDTSLLQEVR